MSKSTASEKAQLADDTLIVLTSKGADLNKVYETITVANCRVLQTVNIIKGGYSLISVKPQPGKLLEAERIFLAISDNNIKALQRNYLDHIQQCPPDDEAFPQQWALTTQRFPQARCRVNQTTSPRITLLDSGCERVIAGDEMNRIQQFKFIAPIIGQAETPFDASSIYHGTGVTGIAASTTNNIINMAGISSVSMRSQVIMCRVGNDSVNRQDIYNALAWCSNNQTLRGGAGPINVSINASPPNTLNADRIIQTLAQTLHGNGDLVVNGAGNSGLEDLTPEQYVRRIAGTDQTNMRWVNSVYGPFSAAAPAVSILTYQYPWELAFRTGTSFATAHWSGAIALLMSLAPGLTASTADSIIYQTATITPQNYHIPNLEAAVRYIRFYPIVARAVPVQPIRP